MKTVLITGGSSGIGYEMSRIWARHDYQLLWISNDARELAAAKSKLESEQPTARIHTLTKDLSTDDGVKETFEWSQSIDQVDVLINNAGFGTYGYLKDIEIEKELTMIHLNVIGLYKMTRLFLSEMQVRNNGTIINICSNSAFQPVPRMTTYAATKGFVYQFSRGLQEEMQILNMKTRILTVCPAAISDTPFRERLSSDVKTFNGLATTTAEEVAQDTWNGFKKGKTFVISGKKMRRLYTLTKFIPYSIQQFLVRKETEKA